MQKMRRNTSSQVKNYVIGFELMTEEIVDRYRNEDGCLMMEAESTAETLVNFWQTTRRNNLENNHLHTRRHCITPSQTITSCQVRRVRSALNQHHDMWRQYIHIITGISLSGYCILIGLHLLLSAIPTIPLSTFENKVGLSSRNP
jgi:hypothetical protein